MKTFRVIFDYGNIEVSVYVITDKETDEEITEAAIDELIRRDFGLGPESPTVIDITRCPEWEKD